MMYGDVGIQVSGAVGGDVWGFPAPQSWGGTPKAGWMVYSGENPMKIRMIWGYPYSWKPPYSEYIVYSDGISWEDEIFWDP